MRFGLIHRIMTDALAALGLLSLITSGELNRWIAGLVLVGLVLTVVLQERWQGTLAMRRFAVIAPLALLATQVFRLFTGGEWLPVAVEFAATLQVIRLATRRGAAHDQQVIVLALLHLMAGTVLGGGLAYGLCFIGFLVIAPGALVLSHLRREVEGNYRQGARDRTGLPVDVPRILRSRRVIGRSFLAFTCLLSIPIFVFTALLFVLFPRVGLSLLLLNHGTPTRVVGFSDRVDLGGVGKLRTDPTIAMRVHYPSLGPEPPPRIALYLRGTAFDRYDGRSWTRTSGSTADFEQAGSYVKLQRYPDPVRDRKLIIDLEPIDPPVLFLPPRAVGLRLPGGQQPLLDRVPKISGGSEGELRYKSANDQGIRYEVFLAGPRELTREPLSEAARERYLRLPKALPERVFQLARRWTKDTRTVRGAAEAIESGLRSKYRYDLESPSGAAKDPLDDFLFVSKRGHCEFYSTAMAVMLRTLGVPTRNVTGFVGGTYNSFGQFYAVRQGDAHSWVEVYVDPIGWVRFDPTPPVSSAPRSEINGVIAFFRDLIEASQERWDRHIVGYNLRQQVQLLRSVQGRYQLFKDRPSLQAAFANPRRTLALLLGLALVGYGLYRLRKRSRAEPRGGAKGAERSLQEERTIQLYRALEAALAARGVGRPLGAPPLAHARALAEMGHPTGNEALRLTHLYLRARFGEAPLTEAEREDFERTVKVLRQSKTKTDLAA